MIQNKFKLRSPVFILGLFLGLIFAGCGIFEVDNPGAIVEEDLNNEIAIPALVAGAGGDLYYIYGYLDSAPVFSGMLADEIQHVGSYPDWRQVDDPDLVITEESISLNNLHDNCARARWVADDGARRIKELLGDPAASSADLAQILVYSGFAHLLLGDLFGAVPIDGGPLISQEEVYQRAVARFTEAIAVGQAAGASEWVQAAYAGRTRAYFSLNDLNKAVADAQQLPAGYRLEAIFSENTDREKNWCYWANITRNECSVSPEIVALYQETRDPRIRCTDNGIGGDGNRPWWIQDKYTSYSAPIRLVGWQEFELIQAEAKLNSGDLAGAIAHINTVRAGIVLDDAENTPLAARGASSDAAEVRAWLIHERRVEFFFEGRRLADCRHFGLLNVIKNDPPFFPIPSNELDTNPNLE
jgi:hypothetical protein